MDFYTNIIDRTTIIKSKVITDDPEGLSPSSCDIRYYV